ncbi:MAG: invasion associated locus B family protein [Micropepsaceae bacterium]
MTSLISKLGWPVYAGAAGFLVLVVVLIYALGGGKESASALANLPPVQTADIQPGFVGEQPFGAWKLVCQNLAAPAAAATGATPKRLCRANARMIVKGPNQKALLAAGFNILMIDTVKNPAIMFRLPLGARAAATIGFAIDKNTMFTAPLKCTEKECVAQGSLPEDALAQMKEGQVLKLIYTIKDKTQKDRKVRVDQLLYGFPQAFEAMTSAMAS